MGRKKLNKSVEEIRANWRANTKKYYHAHQESCKIKMMERYWKRKALKKLNKVEEKD